MLEREELEEAIDSLPWLARGVLKIIGSVDKIMEKCDADNDGAIGMETDMPATEETCLASCFKRKAFKLILAKIGEIGGDADPRLELDKPKEGFRLFEIRTPHLNHCVLRACIERPTLAQIRFALKPDKAFH